MAHFGEQLTGLRNDLISDRIHVVWLRFMPLNGSLLTIMLPKDRFEEMLEKHAKVKIALPIATRNDHMPKDMPCSEAVFLRPDVSARYIHGEAGVGRLSIMTSFEDSAGKAAGTCARSRIKQLSQRIRHEHDIELLLGFEIEVIFIRKEDLTQMSPNLLIPTSQHSWCNVTADDYLVLPMVEDVARALKSNGYSIEKFHAEAAPGQWEFVLPPTRPVAAVDTLVFAREIITTVASRHGFRATLHPKPYPKHATTGSHVHISANPCMASESVHPESFFAGIMEHLPAILAFAMPLDISYTRVAPGIWSGGEYNCWGWENRECPLRRITKTRFEIKCLCGTANPYLAVTALLAAGLDGLCKKLPLTRGNCAESPRAMGESELRELGISECLPKSIGESMARLQADKDLSDLMSPSMVAAYMALTLEWNEHLSSLDENERHALLLAMY